METQNDNFTEEYVQHLEELLESYSTYIITIESYLPESVKRTIRQDRRTTL